MLQSSLKSKNNCEKANTHTHTHTNLAPAHFFGMDGEEKLGGVKYGTSLEPAKMIRGSDS